MRLVVRILGRDILELTTDPDDDPDGPAEPFGFFGGSSLWIERADYDDQPPEDP